MLIGLTGGIATGKSTVSTMFAELGALIIDADQVARDVVAPQTEGLKAIVDAFGRGILSPEGFLDRPRLGAHVFGDPNARRKLESILHPLIAIESMRQIQTAFSQAPPLVVYDAALLIESGRKDDFRPLVVVTIDDHTQCERLMARDGLSLEEAQARISAQMSLKDKASHADYLIDNSRSVEATRTQVQDLVRKLVENDA